MNATAHSRTALEGSQLVDELWKRDLTVMPSPQVPEVGIGEMANLLSGRRLRIFDTLAGLTSEYPLYRRDEKGVPNDADCPLVACAVLLAPIAPKMGPEEDEDEGDGAWNRGRSNVTGY